MTSVPCFIKRDSVMHFGAVLILGVLWAMNTAQAGITETVENALKFGQDDAKYGRMTFDLRYRYEYANTNNDAGEPAHGNTFRIRLGYLTPEFKGLQAFAEYENVFAAQNDYRNPIDGNTGYNVIGDPADQHQLNQLWVTYKGVKDTVIKGGRQRIILDDSRFVGNVGWRQNEQTYDGVLVTNNWIKNTTINAGYIARRLDIFSRVDDMEAPFVNVKYDLGYWGAATGYAYWFDFTDDPDKSTQTYGIRLHGSPKLTDDLTAHYLAEYSFQEDYEKNSNEFNLHRYYVEAGVTTFGVTLKGAMEKIDGDGVNAFQFPFGTNHKFQGWADRFLNTPVDGIRDLQGILSTKVMGAKLMFVYHKFEDDGGNFEYGDEYDVLLVKKFGKHYSLLAKYAYYDGDEDAPGGFKNDTQKVWVQGNISF